MTALTFQPLIPFKTPEKITKKSGLSSVCITLLEKELHLYLKHFPICETKKHENTEPEEPEPPAAGKVQNLVSSLDFN